MENATHLFATVRGHPWRMIRLFLLRFGKAMAIGTHCFVAVRGGPWAMKRLALLRVGEPIWGGTPSLKWRRDSHWFVENFVHTMSACRAAVGFFGDCPGVSTMGV